MNTISIQKTSLTVKMPSITWGGVKRGKKYVPDFLGRMKASGQKPLSEEQVRAILDYNRS